MARVPYRSPEEFEEDSDLLASSMAEDAILDQYRHLYSTEFRHVHRAIVNNPSVLAAFRSYNG